MLHTLFKVRRSLSCTSWCHTNAPALFYLTKYKITRSWLCNYRKTIVKNWNCLLTLVFFLRAFSSFHFEIFFYILSSTKFPLSVNYNNKKTIMKIQKTFQHQVYFFLFLKIFRSFHYTIKMRKYLFSPALFDYEKWTKWNSIHLETWVKFFRWRGKNTILPF